MARGQLISVSHIIHLNCDLAMQIDLLCTTSRRSCSYKPSFWMKRNHKTCHPWWSHQLKATKNLRRCGHILNEPYTALNASWCSIHRKATEVMNYHPLFRCYWVHLNQALLTARNHHSRITCCAINVLYSLRLHSISRSVRQSYPNQSSSPSYSYTQDGGAGYYHLWPVQLEASKK